MVALGQVVLAEFAEQVALPKDGEVVQALGTDRSDEPLRVGIAVGALRRNRETGDAGGLEDRRPRFGEKRIAIVNEVGALTHKAVLG